jgi:hypothetical protein
MKPVVTLLGAGPGDPELLTVKAVKALRRATVALVDDLVDPGVLRYLKRSARVIPVGKRGGCASTPQAFIHKLMVAEALKGERVVRIKGGDPFVFGRGGEDHDPHLRRQLAVHRPHAAGAPEPRDRRRQGHRAGQDRGPQPGLFGEVPHRRGRMIWDAPRNAACSARARRSSSPPAATPASRWPSWPRRAASPSR